MTKRWAVLISGRGSNLGAILEMVESLQAKVVTVYTSNAQAYGAKRAVRRGVTVRAISKIANKLNYSQLSDELQVLGVDGIFLAGFMRVLPAEFVHQWQGKLVNLHPSMLPAYPGLNSIERAIADGAPLGCTVHEVVTEVDAGPIILQRCLSSYQNREDAERRLHLLEQNLVSKVVGRW